MQFIERIIQFFSTNISPKQTIVKNSFWVFLAELMSKWSLALVIIFIWREFWKEIFWQYSYLTIILSFLLIFADLWITQLTTRDYQHVEWNQRTQYLITWLKTKFLLTGIVFLIYCCILYFVISSSFLLIIWSLLFIQWVANSFLEYLRATFRSLQTSEKETRIKFFQWALTLLLIPLIYLTYSLPTVLFWQWIITLITCWYAWLAIKKSSLKNEISTLSENIPTAQYFLYHWWMFALSWLFVSMYYYMDSLIIQRFLWYESVWVYNAAYKIVTVLIVPLSIIWWSLLPTIKNWVYTKSKSLFKNIRRFTRVTWIIYTVLILFFIYFAESIIFVVYWPEYVESWPLLEVLLLTVIIVARYTPLAWSLYAFNLQKWHMIATWIWVTINLILNIILIPRYGMISAARTTLITELIAATIMCLIFFRYQRKSI